MLMPKKITIRTTWVVFALVIGMGAIVGLGLISGTQKTTDPSVSASADYPADINSDGIVNISDLSLLLSKWGSNDAAADINHDGTVAISDLSFLLGKWGTTPPATGGQTAVTHGDQLTESMVGPWALQGVAKGQEQIQKLTLPARGYWRLDTPSEFVPAGNYVYNNNPTNHGGTLATDMTIDGFLVPAGTKVVQFRDFSDGDMLAQGVSGSFLFRGIRARGNAVGGSSFFNDYNATYTNYLHYSDLGGLGAQDNQDGGAFWKSLGGQNHRVLRNYVTYVATAFQPNTVGAEYIENYIDKLTFYHGEVGAATLHLNGISSEGMSNVTPTRFKILRNHITMPSPDDAGRTTLQTDCIALFNSNGGSYNDVVVDGNYLGGSGYVIYAGGSAAKNIRFTNNKISTKWWTNGGNFGAVTAEPVWNSNGNIATGNVWADDYGTGGNGQTPTSGRQYPSGNGPRKGQVIFGQ